jgi:hypothetical protein
MTCWFCGNAEAQENKAVRLELYGEVEASEAADNKKRIAYSTQVFDVPRCAECKKKHGGARLFLGLAAAMAVLIAAAVVSALFNIPGWLWGLALGLGVGFGVMFLVVRSMSQKGIKKESDAKKDYPEIVDLLCKGYKFGKRPSYEEITKPGAGTALEVKKSEPPADTDAL